MTPQIKLAFAATVATYDALWVAIAPTPLTDTFWVALATAVPATIAAVGALLVGLRNSRKADTIIEKAVEIHAVTNANLSKVTASLDIANSKIAGMERLIESMASDRAATLDASKAAVSSTKEIVVESAAVAVTAAMSAQPTKAKGESV